jgi:ABC-type multidrug transport system ATPase subunit
MTDGCVIETTDLRKRYVGIDALRGLTLRVPAGSIVGFLGRNGAGKTTTIKVLLGMARATSGVARLFGQDVATPVANLEARRRIGFVSEEKELYDYMTVDEIIRFTASFYPGWRRDLEDRYRRTFDLPGVRRIKVLSRGMRTKLALLLALCRGAELLILDEPTSGLDPAVTEEVLRALVSHVASEELTIFFSSHQIAEVEQIADRVEIIDRGVIVVSGALDEVLERYCRIQLVFADDVPAYTFRAPGVMRVRRDGRVMTLVSSAGADAVLDEARMLNPTSVNTLPVTLKDIFLETVARED